MVGEISYSQYSELYDEGTKQIQKAYELGKSELEKENAELKDKLKNLENVAEVRLANWQKYEKAYNEAEELLDKQIEATYNVVEENKEAKELYFFLTIVWIFRACLATFIEPWPLEPVAWAAILQLILSDLLAFMMIIMSIKFYKNIKKIK